MGKGEREMNKECHKELRKAIKLIQSVKDDYDTCGRDKILLQAIIEDIEKIIGYNMLKD